MADDPFQPDPNESPAVDPNAKYFEELVGEGKKFKDQEALARSKVESDRFIANLLREQKEMREALAKRTNEEEFLNRLEALSKPKSPEPGNQPPTNGTPESTALTPEKVEEIIAKREAERSRKANLDASIGRLQELFGDDYKRHVQKQAASMGVGTDFLTSVASENPQAFLRLMGVEGQTRQPDAFSAPPRSSVNTTTTTRTDVKNYEYYKKLRETKGENFYFSPAVQQELWQNLTQMGEEEFYKR